jgi:hypothetical protein
VSELVPPDQRDRQRAYRRVHSSPVAPVPRPDPLELQRSVLRRRCQRVAFLTGSARQWIKWAFDGGDAHGWTLAFCADPNPSYAQHLTVEAVTLARDLGFHVAAWCGLLGMEHSGFDGPGARFAKKACADFGLDWWYGQFETPEEWEDCIEQGATLGIGNPNALTYPQMLELADEIADARFAYVAEVYSNIPNWPMPNQYGAPAGCSPASLCAGAGNFDGGHLPVRDWINAAPLEHKGVLSIYDAGMSPDDFAALPRGAA